MNAKQVCGELGLSPGYLAEVLKREMGYQHEHLAVEARSALGPERGGFRLQHLAHLLALVRELEEEWELTHPDDEVAEVRVLGKVKGDGAKEASSAAVARPGKSSGRSDR